LNKKFNERSIKARILSKQNYLYIRGTFADSKGDRKDRKIPLIALEICPEPKMSLMLTFSLSALVK